MARKKPHRQPAPTPAPPPAAPGWREEVWVALGLAVLTLASFAPLWLDSYDFINLDDTSLVIDNPDIKDGLTFRGIGWAFTTLHGYNWMPLTWLSFELDSQLHGTRPWGYHLTNVLLHTSNVLLLFVVLRRLTGALWRSAAVAALFAVHPLRVESVAWVAERKDVLSALFWMLTLGAYGWYALRPSPRRYALVVLTFALGLMAKPMLVTLPFVLLLMDYWPLRRFRSPALRASGDPTGPTFPSASLARLLLEKAPLLALAAGLSAITLHAQRELVLGSDHYSFATRAANALVSYVRYLGKTFWPADLALYYPHPGDSLPAAAVVGAALLLAGVTAAAVWAAPRRPSLAVGWLWYLGTLVPVAGFVQLSNQGHADRWTYIPLIGIFLLVAWQIAALAGRRGLRAVAALGLAAAVVACALVSWVQVHYWSDSITLWTHTLEVTGDGNAVAQNALGGAYLEAGDLDLAEPHFLAAARLNPNYSDPRYNLGTIRLRRGDVDGAARWFADALRINPNHAGAQAGMALVRQARGQN
jgi:tetratricopeptide (TPR) repeat protein